MIDGEDSTGTPIPKGTGDAARTTPCIRSHRIHQDETVRGGPDADPAGPPPAGATSPAVADLEEFRRALVEIGLVTDEELARFTAATPPAATLQLSPCELEHPLRLTAVAAECGVLRVPENPQQPAGRQIELHVARVAAISRRKQPDPLFVLAGGPGAAAGAFYASVAGAFARILRERDIVLVDQRGTGGSNALDCPESDDLLGHVSDAEVKERTRACLDSLASRADVAFYTTSLAVQDLERVRAALGHCHHAVEYRLALRLINVQRLCFLEERREGNSRAILSRLAKAFQNRCTTVHKLCRFFLGM